MDGFQVCELVVVGVDADAEEEASVATIHDLVVPELIHADKPLQAEAAYVGSNAPRRSSTGTSGPAARLTGAPPLADGPSARPARQSPPSRSYP